MKVTVNGTQHRLDTSNEETAVTVLRDTLRLTGTKLVCGSGVCGACTIQVDGKPMVSCLLSGAALEGRSVTTVEGLGGPHPIQRALAAHDGLQCGYCSPGFVIEAAAFVDRWRAEYPDLAPDRTAIADALAGHLCRCGAYAGIYAAVAAACTGAHDVDDGLAPPRVEAMDKLTGRARYTTDVCLDGQVEGVIVRSASAHAVIGTVKPPAGATLIEMLPEDRTVRYVGQVIAAVTGVTLAQAQTAASQVVVEYDDRPPVLGVIDAARPELPLVYASKPARKAAPGNLLQRNRCWYYRNRHFSCFQTGGDGCPARDGLHMYSAVIDQGPCVAPHPSSIAMSLLAYDARAEVHERGRLPVSELYGDGSDPTRDHLLGQGEVLTSVQLPIPAPGERAAYHRAVGRAEAEWPLVEAVSRLVVDGSTITAAGVAVGGVARIPLRLPEVEAALVGIELVPDSSGPLLAAAETALARCSPLPQTGYKVGLLRDTVLEVLERAAAPPV